jgi:rfaE bifunctional protein nucleotidyltransferase chain/domain
MGPEKIIGFDKAPELFAEFRKQGKKIVHCHGTFDLVHPGHIQHLEEAKALGDLLVVTITGEKFVNKGPGRPYFNDAMRCKNLGALMCVDYVVVIPFPAAVEAIECIKADVYCKGKEYEDPSVDVTGNINEDVLAVQKWGGEIRYIGSIVYSSTKLINRHFQVVSPKVKAFCADLSSRVTPEQIRQKVDAFDKLKVLVIGDVIFDRYSYLKVQGLTSKNRIISGRFLKEETHGGGSLAVYRHIRQFSSHVKLIGLVGEELWVDGLLRESIPAEDDWLVRSKEFTTIIKRRFVEPVSEGKEMIKLFSVNYIDGAQPAIEVQDRVLQKIASVIKDFDVVFVTDFGHGLMMPTIRDYVQDHAPFMVLNCQTNSNNHGFNIISRQYRKADAFSLDEQEILLSSGKRGVEFTAELEKLQAMLGAKYAWLTRGAVETVGLKKGEKFSLCPPVENDVTDTVGAGDAFFSLAGLAAAQDLPVDISTFLGQLAGAQAVKIVGNQESISKVKILKAVQSLLSM